MELATARIEPSALELTKTTTDQVHLLDRLFWPLAKGI